MPAAKKAVAKRTKRKYTRKAAPTLHPFFFAISQNNDCTTSNYEVFHGRRDGQSGPWTEDAYIEGPFLAASMDDAVKKWADQSNEVEEMEVNDIDEIIITAISVDQQAIKKYKIVCKKEVVISAAS